MYTFKQGYYRIGRIGFKKADGKRRQRFYLPKRFTMRFERDTVYYLGDVTFFEDHLTTSYSTETIQLLCNKHEVLRSAKEVYVVFSGPEPIKLEAPCQQE